MSKKVFNPIVPPFDQTANSLLDLDSRNHSDLTNLTWSTAGHTIDTNVDFAGYNANNVGTLGINATSDHTIYNTSDDLYIKNPNSNKAIYFNINRNSSVNNFIKIDANAPQFLVTNQNTLTISDGLMKVTGTWTTGIAAAAMTFSPTITGGSWYGFFIAPVINAASQFTGISYEPSFGNYNRTVPFLRFNPATAHTVGYSDTYNRYSENFTRSFFIFAGNDATTVTYNPFDIGASISLGDLGFTNVTVTETMIKLTGGSSRAVGTGGTITQKGLLFSGWGTIATNTTIRPLEADGGLFSFKYDYSTTSRLLFGAGEDVGMGYDGTDFIINPQLVGTGDVLIPVDSAALALGAGSGGDMRVYYDGTNGNIDTDAVAASDLVIDCGTDKTIVLEETVWDDLRVTPAGFDLGTSNYPALVSYTPTGSSIATQLWEFKKNDIAYFTVQLPHSYKEGTNINVHIHWTPGLRGNEENGATVGWKVDYAWANIDGTFGAMSTADLSDACDGTDDKHQMTPSVAITGTSKNISSMLICNVKRTDTGTDDTWAGTTTGNLPMILEIDFHYEIDTIGSRQVGTK